MNEDDGLSKKLAEVEERKNKYLAREVETADRDKTVENAASQPGRPEKDVEPQEDIVSWIECSGDRRSWADVHEEEYRIRGTTESFNSSVVEARFQENIGRLEASINSLRDRIEESKRLL